MTVYIEGIAKNVEIDKHVYILKTKMEIIEYITKKNLNLNLVLDAKALIDQTSPFILNEPNFYKIW